MWREEGVHGEVRGLRNQGKERVRTTSVWAGVGRGQWDREETPTGTRSLDHEPPGTGTNCQRTHSCGDKKALRLGINPTA